MRSTHPTVIVWLWGSPTTPVNSFATGRSSPKNHSTNSISSRVSAMPIYEYRCNDCGRYQSVFVRTYTNPTDLSCTRCQGTHLRKLVSRFAVLRSDESRLEQLADPSALGDVDENDPKSVARWARKMGDEVG